MFLFIVCSRIAVLAVVLVMTPFLRGMQKMALCSRVKSSFLAIKSEKLQHVPTLKQELEDKDALITELGK